MKVEGRQTWKQYSAKEGRQKEENNNVDPYLNHFGL